MRKKHSILLGVNIDHVATVRQARREVFPSPCQLAQEAIVGGATGITAHLREDRRHIQDSDILQLKKKLRVPLNMEMAVTPEMVKIACQVKPSWVCLVPEKRAELTTEGGLNLETSSRRIQQAIHILHQEKIKVSLFVDANVRSMELAATWKADAVELHTGLYARLFGRQSAFKKELTKIGLAAQYAQKRGLLVNAGHGLDYRNTPVLAQLFPFHEFNIGFAIVARALSVGMKKAVQEMKQRMT